jgi:hypothetical protein
VPQRGTESRGYRRPTQAARAYPARSKSPVVQHSRDSPQRSAFVAQPPDFSERLLFHWIGFRVFAARGEPVSSDSATEIIR